MTVLNLTQHASSSEQIEALQMSGCNKAVGRLNQEKP
jgi:hypothetical protein